jgi:hypothetical protein
MKTYMFMLNSFSLLFILRKEGGEKKKKTMVTATEHSKAVVAHTYVLYYELILWTGVNILFFSIRCNHTWKLGWIFGCESLYV